MKVSLNTIKEFTTVDLPVDELVAKINAQLGGVEKVEHLGAKYDGATIVKIVECGKHPNADKLSVCMVDDGSGEMTQVVCGAPNVRTDMFAVWLKPGMIVPSTADDDEPLVLGARELRGVMSNGMLAAGDELAINSDHNGIVEISQHDLAPGMTLQAGNSFAETFNLNDIIIDIENKMFTHRPDLFGQLGVAREIAGILGHQFDEPEWYWNVPKLANATGLKLDIFNDAVDKVPRIMAVAMNGVSVAPSPLWLQTTLLRWGAKAINNIVDITNYIMLLTAQPTHAYDYDKIRGGKLGARMAISGEKVTLLNGKTYELTSDDIVMADAEGPVGLAGVMGGGDSEVDVQTKNIVLEVATFDMYAVRKSAMRHGVFTDALTRFNKGQSPLQNDRVLAKLMNDMGAYASATQATSVYEKSTISNAQRELNSMQDTMQITADFINRRLGLQLSEDEICILLEHVSFTCLYGQDNRLHITAPFWRTDIEVPEDIVEEVGRLYGFDKLPRVLPARTSKPATTNVKLQLKQKIREYMKLFGANEVLTYSFVHERVLTRAEQQPAEAFKLSNALSPDLQYYRLSLLPSLLDKVHANIKSGYNEFMLYELGKGHNKQNFDGDLPVETDLLEIVYAEKQEKSEAAFYQIRRVVEQLMSELNTYVDFHPIDQEMSDASTTMFDQERSALVKTSSGDVIGIIGEFKQSVTKSFKLPARSAGASLNFDAIQSSSVEVSSYIPLSRYPSVSQDISLKVNASINYMKIMSCAKQIIERHLNELRIVVSPITIYQPKPEDDKTFTLRFIVTSQEKTLTDSDVKTILDEFALSVNQTLDAIVV